MTTDNIPYRYSDRDVVYFTVFHESTTKPAATPEKRKYEMEGKQRPMLIVRRATCGEYSALKFTGKKPQDPRDFFKKPDGRPKDFGKHHGFDELCYLQIFPLRTCHDNNAVKKQTTLAEEFFRAIVTAAARRLQEAP